MLNGNLENSDLLKNEKIYYCLGDNVTYRHEKLTFSISYFQYYDLAADVLAENAHLTYKYLTPVCILCFLFGAPLVINQLVCVHLRK